MWSDDAYSFVFLDAFDPSTEYRWYAQSGLSSFAASLWGNLNLPDRMSRLYLCLLRMISAFSEFSI